MEWVRLVGAAILAFVLAANSVRAEQADVVVVGGTPGGIASALAAGRAGRSVILVEYHDHVGGMTASGLGKSDVEKREMIGGLFREFVDRVYRHYVEKYGKDHENVKLCRDGYYFEPSVAEAAFERMLSERTSVSVLKGWRLASAQVNGNRMVAVDIVNRKSGETRTLQGRVFIDATYEGDLYEAAGAEFRVGRESRDLFGEPHAGVIYFDYENHRFLPGSTGQADTRLPAYTCRLCLTTNPTTRSG